MSDTKTCTIEDCDMNPVSRGWCHKHYTRWLRHGDPLGGRFHNKGSLVSMLDELNITYRIVDYWCRTGVVHLTTEMDRGGSGSRRVPTDAEKAALRVVAEEYHKLQAQKARFDSGEIFNEALEFYSTTTEEMEDVGSTR